MGILSVILAAVAGFAWGAIWYSVMAKPWMAAAGLTEETINRSNPVPYVISIAGVLLVAGMMRHMFVGSGIDEPMKGLTSGLGIGLFITVPWLATNYAFAQRPLKLGLIDAAYSTVGCAVIGLVLTLV